MILLLFLLAAIPCAAQTMIEGAYFMPENVRAAHLREVTLRSLDTMGPDGKGVIFWHTIFNDQGNPIYSGSLRMSYSRGCTPGPRERVFNPTAIRYGYDTAGRPIRMFSTSLAGSYFMMTTWRYDARGQGSEELCNVWKGAEESGPSGLPSYTVALEDTACQSEFGSVPLGTPTYMYVAVHGTSSDDRGRLAEQWCSSHDEDGTWTRLIRYTYDQRDSVIERTTIDNGTPAYRVVSTFDSLGRLTRLIDFSETSHESTLVASRVSTVTYDQNGSTMTDSFPGSSYAIRRRFDPKSNLLERVSMFGDTVTERETWRYDDRGLPMEGEIRYYLKEVATMEEQCRIDRDGKERCLRYRTWHTEPDPSPRADRYRYEYVFTHPLPEKEGSLRSNLR